MKALIEYCKECNPLLLKDILRTLCNISNSEIGKRGLVECGILKVLSDILETNEDFEIRKPIIACMANISMCNEYKSLVAQHGFLKSLINIFEQSLIAHDTELTKYCMYFVGNVCDKYAEASFVLGDLSIISLLKRFFSEKWDNELIAEGIDTLCVLLQVKDNL